MEPQSRVRLQDGDFLESSKVLVSPSSDEESGQVFFSLYFDANNQAILADFIGLNFLQLVDLTAFSGKEGSSIQISLTENCAHLPLDFEIVNFEVPFSLGNQPFKILKHSLFAHQILKL